MDTELVDSMFQAFCHELVEQRQVHVFVDRNRLEDGRNFKTDFSQAVMHSTVLVLIVSKAALHKMLRLQEDSEDNVLLEWTMVAELLEIRALDYCLPVMIGEVSDDTASITNLFKDGIVDELPEMTCSSVTTQVEKLLRKNGHEPSPELHTRTVRSTVKKLLEGLGVPTWDISSSHGGGNGVGRPTPGLRWTEVGLEKPKTGTEIKNALLAGALQHKKQFSQEELDTFQLTTLSYGSYIKVQFAFGDKYFKPARISTHSYALWKRKVHSHVVEKVMKCVHKAESEGKSKVGHSAVLMVEADALKQMHSSRCTQADALKQVFGKHGLAEICEKVCDELGISTVDDLSWVGEGDVHALTWLKLVHRKKLSGLISEAKSLKDGAKKDESEKDESSSSAGRQDDLVLGAM
jgi:hypothetical protein